MPDNLIYDIGMNNGDDTAHYLCRGFRVVAVEANPVLAEAGTKRFAPEIADGRLTILNVGVAERAGDLPFWVCDANADWSSFDEANAARDDSPHHQIVVPCRTFASIYDEYGVPFYLKIDIEGNDELCVRDLDPARLPRYISLEGRDIELLAMLRDLGYTRFKCISQHTFLPLELPPTPEQVRYEQALARLRSRSIPTRALMRLGLRQAVEEELSKTRTIGDWTFNSGSSGPFADQLPGRWQTFEELSKTYLHYKSRWQSGESGPFWTDKPYSFWTDFHAKFDP